jgi:hypothetical protein
LKFEQQLCYVLWVRLSLTQLHLRNFFQIRQMHRVANGAHRQSQNADEKDHPPVGEMDPSMPSSDRVRLRSLSRLRTPGLSIQTPGQTGTANPQWPLTEPPPLPAVPRPNPPPRRGGPRERRAPAGRERWRWGPDPGRPRPPCSSSLPLGSAPISPQVRALDLVSVKRWWLLVDLVRCGTRCWEKRFYDSVIALCESGKIEERRAFWC